MSSFQKNMSEGSVLKNLIMFALPFLASNLVQSLYNVADMLIVGNFCGPESMSGVNIGGQVTFVLTNLVIGLALGATVLIGQYVGSNQPDKLKKVTATIMTMLVGIGLAITIIMLMFKGQVLELIQTPAESLAESDAYLTVTLTGIVFIFAYNALSAILRGMGDSKSPMYFVTIACVTNIVLDLIFVGVFGWKAFGAAFATVISQALSVVLCVIYMKRRNFQFDFRIGSFKIDKEQLKLIFKIGMPTCIQNAVTSISFLFITAVINGISMTASAGVGAAGKFNSFVFMPVMALSSSVSTISAQNIGAGRLDRAVHACRIGVVISAVICAVFFAVVRAFPEGILRMFGSDPQMIADGVTYMNTFSYDFLLIPFIFCINGMLIGGGHTLFTLINSILSAVVLRAPAAYILGVQLGWGLTGAGLAAPLASGASLLLIIIFLISGKWKVNVVKGALAVE